MRVNGWIQRSIPLAAVALVCAAPSIVAQQRGQEVFEWNGRVDREIQISIRGDRLTTRDVGNSETGRQNSRVLSTLPRGDGQLTVQLLRGRGSAQVIEQPSSRNGYTATVRIQDPSSGADDYRIAAYWQNYSGGDVYGRNGNVDRREDRRDSRDRNNSVNGNNGINGVGRVNNNQNVLHWSGNVDGELELRIQNGRVDYRTLSGNQPTAVRADRGNAGSQRASGQMFVTQNQGRGSVTIVQQPSAYNSYTTVLRVRDPQGGYGFYDFDLMMQ